MGKLIILSVITQYSNTSNDKSKTMRMSFQQPGGWHQHDIEFIF